MWLELDSTDKDFADNKLSLFASKLSYKKYTNDIKATRRIRVLHLAIDYVIIIVPSPNEETKSEARENQKLKSVLLTPSVL